MSADNWTQCPRCHAKRVGDLDDEKARLDQSYGRVSVERYMEMVAKLKRHSEEEGEETFREDYEIGLARGEFYVEYSGRCTACGLAFSFSATQKVPLE